MSQSGGAHLLVPVKSFSEAKARLASRLTLPERSELARWMAVRVIDAADGMATHVVCDDADVAAWAASCGADVLWSPGTGLDSAVRGGVAELVRRGATHVVVCHGDLPRARHLSSVIVDGCVTIVPDRHGDGSNVIAVPATLDFPFSYGRRSFDRHVAAAVTASLPLVVRRDPELAIDIDTPDDLDHPLVQEVLPQWLRTNRDNRTMSTR